MCFPAGIRYGETCRDLGSILSDHLAEGGVVVINDAYIEDSSTFEHSAVLPYREILNQIGQAEMELIDECTEGANAYTEEFENLQRRCRELMAKYPDKTTLFGDFIRAQSEEYDVLENEIIGSVMVIKRV